jgi:hypothetical protein
MAARRQGALLDPMSTAQGPHDAPLEMARDLADYHREHRTAHA